MSDKNDKQIEEISSKKGASEKTFTKEQLLQSEKFGGRKDALNALLSPDKQYTVKTAEEIIDKYMKGKVE